MVQVMVVFSLICLMQYRLCSWVLKNIILSEPDKVKIDKLRIRMLHGVYAGVTGFICTVISAYAYVFLK